jgi:hypothetical protein
VCVCVCVCLFVVGFFSRLNGIFRIVFHLYFHFSHYIQSIIVFIILHMYFFPLPLQWLDPFVFNHLIGCSPLCSIFCAVASLYATVSFVRLFAILPHYFIFIMPLAPFISMPFVPGYVPLRNSFVSNFCLPFQTIVLDCFPLDNCFSSYNTLPFRYIVPHFYAISLH